MIDDHVPTYETCIKMRDLGFPQNTSLKYGKLKQVFFAPLDAYWHVAAPLLSEILKKLPGDEGIEFLCLDGSHTIKSQGCIETDKNSAEAAGKLWIKIEKRDLKEKSR